MDLWAFAAFEPWNIFGGRSRGFGDRRGAGFELSDVERLRVDDPGDRVGDRSGRCAAAGDREFIGERVRRAREDFDIDRQPSQRLSRWERFWVRIVCRRMKSQGAGKWNAFVDFSERRAGGGVFAARAEGSVADPDNFHSRGEDVREGDRAAGRRIAALDDGNVPMIPKRGFGSAYERVSLEGIGAVGHRHAPLRRGLGGGCGAAEADEDGAHGQRHSEDRSRPHLSHAPSSSACALPLPSSASGSRWPFPSRRPRRRAARSAHPCFEAATARPGRARSAR